MRWTSIVGIYLLFWVLSAFIVLPFGVRTPDEENVAVSRGHADSAPVNFSARRIIKRATAVSVVLFGLFYLNYVNGWILASDLDVSRFYSERPQ